MKFKLIVSERNTTQILTRREKIKFFMMRWADSIVPNSYSQEQFIKAKYPNLASKLTTITNFVDTETFTPLNYNVANLCRIVSVGRVSEQKNTLRFLEVIRQLKDEGKAFKVDWYGYSSPQYLKLCKDYLQDNNLLDVFAFHEPTTQIVNIYQQCDFFVLPSVYEGFPNVICEAMCCGKPIGCSNICDNPLIVEDGINGYLFNPLDVNDMKEKITAFIELSNIAKKEMGEKSRQLSLKKFSSQSFIKKYTELIEH